jgi:hypothetical protein
VGGEHGLVADNVERGEGLAVLTEVMISTRGPCAAAATASSGVSVLAHSALLRQHGGDQHEPPAGVE